MCFNNRFSLVSVEGGNCPLLHLYIKMVDLKEKSTVEEQRTSTHNKLCFSGNNIVISGCCQVNGTAVVPPVTSIRGVKIYLSGKFVVLETSFNLRVRFDGNHHADVTLPTSYNGLLCGMCGKSQCNYLLLFLTKWIKHRIWLIKIEWFWISVVPTGNFNGNPNDDNLKPDNTPAANTNELGDSWQVADSDPEWVTLQKTEYKTFNFIYL